MALFEPGDAGDVLRGVLGGDIAALLKEIEALETARDLGFEGSAARTAAAGTVCRRLRLIRRNCTGLCNSCALSATRSKVNLALFA